MKCKKCGSEIKEGNLFCVNCGASIENNKLKEEKPKQEKSKQEKQKEEKTKEQNSKEDKNAKKTTKNKLKIIIPIVVVTAILIITGTVIVLNKNHKSNNSDISDKTEQGQEIENSKVELGVNYNVVSDGQAVKSVGFVRFNTNTDYIMELGDYASESFTTTGNYVISGNMMTLTVNYDSSEEEETTTPYTEKIEILEDGTLKYTNRYNVTYSFSKDAKEEGQDEENKDSFLNEIYAKYPEAKNGGIPICTDDNGTYWLLDENGKKVYFSSLETFESALEKCNEGEEKTKTVIDIDKFIKELGYSSMSTVHNSNYGGDGYRSDNGFFNSDLSKNSFEIKTNGNETIYTTTSKNQSSSNEPITLEIVVTDNNILKEIKLSGTSTSMKINNIMLCAKEVEDALGYTLINARNYQIVDKVEKELKLENYVSGENGKVIQKNQSVTMEDENENKTVTFTIGENSFEYKMVF